MRILVIDVGGTHMKVLITGRKKRVEFPSGPNMIPAKMVAAVRCQRLLRTVESMMPFRLAILGCGSRSSHY